VVTRLTPELQEYVEKGKPFPALAAIPRVAEPLLSELLARLETTPDPRLAARLGRVLAFTPEERVVESFIRKLTNGFAGQTLEMDEVYKIADLAFHLGFLAREKDSALAFLKQGITLSFWAEHRQWKVSGWEDVYPNKTLAGDCWRGIGISGRPDAMEYLLEYRNGQRRLEPRWMAGAVVSAAFFWHEAQKPAPTEDGARSFMRRYDQWKQTEEGRAWDAWYHQKPVSPKAE
jgi:hypothetical protein